MLPTLINIVDNQRTNINTTHSYLELYQQILQPRQLTTINVLLVGFQHTPGNVLLWYNFFPNATISAFDHMYRYQLPADLIGNDRINAYPETDAYSRHVANHLEHSGVLFDLIIDNGPRNFECIIRFILIYFPLLSNDGVLIIENIPLLEWCDTFELMIPMQFRNCVHVYDRRNIRHQFDDIVLIVDKRQSIS